MNLSKRDIKLLLILSGIIVFALCYFAVYNVYTQQNERLEREITVLKRELSELSKQSGSLREYTQGISQSREFMLKSQGEYPSEITPQELIMYVAQLEQAIGISTNGITFLRPTAIMELEVLEPGANGGYEFQSGAAVRVGVSLNFNLTYQQLKDLCEYVYGDSQKTVLSSFGVSYNANANSGLLSGSVTLERYYLNAYPRNPADIIPIPGMATGLPAPFGETGLPAPSGE